MEQPGETLLEIDAEIRGLDQAIGVIETLIRDPHLTRDDADVVRFYATRLRRRRRELVTMADVLEIEAENRDSSPVAGETAPRTHQSSGERCAGCKCREEGGDHE